MSNRKTTNKLAVINSVENPKKALSTGRMPIQDKSLCFSFALFDRSHELFNLGDSTDTGTLRASWYIDLLDCLKSASNMTIPQLRQSAHKLHPIDFKNTNVSLPEGEQNEYWQFRINKSKGRIIGEILDNVFYIVWLDPHHNLTDSVGYGTAQYYRPAQSLYEKNEAKINSLSKEVDHLKSELETAYELLDESR